MPDNFFAMLQDGTIRRIALLQHIENSIRNVFMTFGPSLLEGRTEEEFDGNYQIEDDEILYVTMELPDALVDVQNNPIGIPILNLEEDSIKALFWIENNVYYFQNFDNRKLLRHRNVIFFNNQTFDKLTENAFVIENAVNAVYQNGRFMFLSYSNANKIFSLLEFYEEATNAELTEFTEHGNVSISDPQWLIDNSNTVIRKHITLIQKSKVLDGADTKKIKKSANKFKVSIDLDESGKIIFPQDKKVCRDILYFLNEQFYEGVITKRQYRTNSKKIINQTPPKKQVNKGGIPDVRQNNRSYTSVSGTSSGHHLPVTR